MNGQRRTPIIALKDLQAPPWRPVPSRQIAKMLGVSLQSLANWRVRETGPPVEPHRKGRGNRTYYRPDEVLAWCSGGEVQAWEVNQEWLRARGIEVATPSREAVEWMIESIDPLISG